MGGYARDGAAGGTGGMATFELAGDAAPGFVAGGVEGTHPAKARCGAPKGRGFGLVWQEQPQVPPLRFASVQMTPICGEA